MRTPAEKAALSRFVDAATSDADPGYQHGAGLGGAHRARTHWAGSGFV